MKTLPQPKQPYAANRATALFEARHLVAAPADHREPWTGMYSGSLSLTGEVEGRMGYTFQIDETGDDLFVTEGGIIDCVASRAPSNQNLATCGGGYRVHTYGVAFELAIAMHDGKLDVALVSGGNLIVGTLNKQH